MEKRIDFATFRQLLQSLENSDTAIRLRMSGEEWMDFTKLILLSESAMIVEDPSMKRAVKNLRHVVEFEVDEPVLELSPFSLYEIDY